MVRTITFLSLMQAAGLLVLGAGCASSSAKQQAGLSMAPSLGQPAKPGPVKEFAAKVGDSSFGQSVSKVFSLASTKKPAPRLVDPVSLAEKPKPPDANLYVSLGDLRVRENDTESAREMYHKALKMDPHHLGALLGLARLFDRQGQLDRAAKHYVEATKYHPKDASAFNDLGLCYARQGKYDDSVTALQHAIKLKPDRILYRNNIATVLVAQGRVDEALAHLTDAHGVAAAHYNIGFLLNKRGRQRQALEHFALALQANPKLDAARDWVASLTAELNGSGRPSLFTANNPMPPSARRQGPNAAPNAPAAPSGNGMRVPASGPAQEPELEAFEPRQRPQNRLRDSERIRESSQEEAAPEAPADAHAPGSDAEQESSGDEAPEANPSKTGEEREARLQYLPPVQSAGARPSRY
ncbi:MAG TPA: tetratricopeptide repeat protein [Pirellulales bacterium]|nr:tetratricopeptide repeat protein [Pirellulales bacterium]